LRPYPDSLASVALVGRPLPSRFRPGSCSSTIRSSPGRLLAAQLRDMGFLVDAGGVAPRGALRRSRRNYAGHRPSWTCSSEGRNRRDWKSPARCRSKPGDRADLSSSPSRGTTPRTRCVWAHEAGCDRFLVKPLFLVEVLVETIRTLPRQLPALRPPPPSAESCSSVGRPRRMVRSSDH